jgi:hypothetical protein
MDKGSRYGSLSVGLIGGSDFRTDDNENWIDIPSGIPDDERAVEGPIASNRPVSAYHEPVVPYEKDKDTAF